jgi:hypothetical protein
MGDAERIAEKTAATIEAAKDEATKVERKQWMEISCAVVLSLATTASAWCAYQSQLWGGSQIDALASAARAGRESTEHTIAAVQYRMFDAMMLIKYTEMRAHGDKELDQFLYDRFRPEMKNAMAAWLKTDPFNDPKAPRTPFDMPEYVQKHQDAAKSQDLIAEQMEAVANHASHQSDTYLLLTVIFASVLFFGGIASTFQSQRLQLVMSMMALSLFAGTVVALAMMPVCPE